MKLIFKFFTITTIALVVTYGAYAFSLYNFGHFPAVNINSEWQELIDQHQLTANRWHDLWFVLAIGLTLAGIIKKDDWADFQILSTIGLCLAAGLVNGLIAQNLSLGMLVGLAFYALVSLICLTSVISLVGIKTCSRISLIQTLIIGWWSTFLIGGSTSLILMSGYLIGSQIILIIFGLISSATAKE